MDKKNTILDVAQRHFTEYGYEKASIAKIAEEAGVSKGLVFWHFESKSGLFNNLIKRFLNLCVINIQKHDEHLNAHDYLKMMIDAFLEFIEEHQNIVRFFLIWFMRPRRKQQQGTEQLLKLYHQFQYLLEERLKQGIAEGLFREDLDVEGTALLILANLEGIFIQMCISQEKNTGKGKRNMLYETLKRNLFEGICKRA